MKLLVPQPNRPCFRRDSGFIEFLARQGGDAPMERFRVMSSQRGQLDPAHVSKQNSFFERLIASGWLYYSRTLSDVSAAEPTASRKQAGSVRGC